MHKRLSRRRLHKVVLSVVLILSTAVGAGTQQAVAQAACSTSTTPATTYGQVKQSVSVTTTGTYRVWSRIKAPDTTNNSYYLQFDGGCAVNVGDASSIPANSWTWVNYQNGNISSYVDVALTAGSHQLTYTGKEANVQLDRVLLLGDTGCVPTGVGDNCAVVDQTAPTAAITAPTAGTTVTVGASVTISASAADAAGIAKVEFYVDGALKSTDASSPYSYAWSTTGVTAGAHSLTTRAYDANGNTSTSAAVSVTIKAATTPPTADTTAPTVGLTTPAAKAAVTAGASVTVSATASDNVGVTKVEFYNGTTLLGLDTTSPYSYVWNTTGVATGAKSLTAKAYDAAGNVQTSSAVSLSLTTTAPPVLGGDANNDGRVNGIDYSILSEHSGEVFAPADFNKDGAVGAADLAILLAKWTW